MSEDPSSTSGSPSRSWFGRLTQALSGEPKSREDLLDELRSAQAAGLLTADTLSMIEGAIAVSDLQVGDVMVPRGQMVAIALDSSPAEALQVVVDSGHSRFPVHGDDRDEIVGILLAKDLLRGYALGAAPELSSLLRPAVLIPESKRLNVLLKEFRQSRNHMAIVVDEFGGVAGLVTIEDLLEQIVGDIDDEHDDAPAEDEHVEQTGQGCYEVEALMPIAEFNERFGAELSDDEYDTIGGLFIAALGHVPEIGETLELGGFQLSVLESDGRRLHTLELRLVDAE
jgi:magnesium and cobalt transporter